MDLALPDRIPLAHLPTPLEPLDAVGRPAGLDLWIKRDDLTGCALTGNKVRKLEFQVAEAKREGADVLITCGAVTSNHARATAVAAARVGMRSHLLLRGRPSHPPSANLLLDRWLGAEVSTMTRADWPRRDALMAALAAEHTAAGRHPYVVPEGGSNALGSLGYARAAHEILAHATSQGLPLQRVVHATGSGGTTAGLALGFAALDRQDVDVIGIAVCESRAYFDGVVRRILEEAVARGFAHAAVAGRARWEVLDGHQGAGYARPTTEELRFHADVARRTGIVVDPVYSGKALRGLVRATRGGEIACEGTTVFLHTGGIFGLFAFAREIDALDAAPDA